MSNYIFGGLGLAAIGLGFQPYITLLQPYSLYFIFGGLFLFILPLLLKFFRWVFKNKNETKSLKNEPSHINNFPAVDWLTGKEVMEKHNISAIELYQHIRSGLDVYPKDFSTIMLGEQAQSLSTYDVSFEIDYDISNSSEMYDYLKGYHFKVSDIEKYQRTKK